ncbi:hypothetical protein GPECTOR_18g118 [Gonium pectorale]|uniref:Uncharacterized protein n=1 Tax=Gonium pectorale TaxID=33097 RepID=A0A150GKT4_GONPE|nr:hypothetical protein GPECTOR_18g118 [Gonium pectorale]|eukprot:KXZ49960.1 hypothetical protein GPECTOR_18g118 [Gonium pectorale]
MNLIEVLQAAQPAARKLVGILQSAFHTHTLKNLRLTCRELCALVDENVSELKLTVRQQDHEPWSTGQLPSLERWPVYSRVRLRLKPSNEGDGSSDNGDDGDLAALACFPFIGLALQQRQRISHLRLFVEMGDTSHAAWQAEDVVLALASLLPGLQDLDLFGFEGMSYEPVRQQLMFNALASITQLKELTLPSGRSLEHLSPLAGRLRKLSVVTTPYPEAEGVTPKGAACLSQLHGLQEFNLSVASVHTLTYDYCVNGYGDVRIRLEDGRIQEMILSETDGPDNDNGYASKDASAFASAAAAIMSSRAMGPRLERLQLSGLSLDDTGGPSSLEAPELRPLWALARRSNSVDVTTLHATSVAAMKDLGDRVATASSTGRSDASDSEDEQEALLVSYQVLPRSCGAVLAAFRDAEELLSAVEAVAASLSPDLTVTSAAAAYSAEKGVLEALEQELQSCWDAWLPGCGGHPAAEAVLLLRLLGIWEQLVGEMPPEVKM